MSENTTRPPRVVRPAGLTADVAELVHVALRDRWSVGLVAIAWVHLATFLTSHAMYRGGDLAAPRYMVLWFVELVAVVILVRRMVTRNGTTTPPPLTGLLVRVWITFLILGLSVAAMNNLTGMSREWFKPVWGTLSTFGFAMMGWLVSLWFLIPAVQMSLTAMLMAHATEQAYLTYAISWWLALHLVALAIEWARATRTEGTGEDVAVTTFRRLIIRRDLRSPIATSRAGIDSAIPVGSATKLAGGSIDG